jgi:hypothetical protein
LRTKLPFAAVKTTSAKAVAIEAAEHLKRKHPNSEVVVTDLRSGEGAAVAYKPDAGRC